MYIKAIIRPDGDIHLYNGFGHLKVVDPKTDKSFYAEMLFKLVSNREWEALGFSPKGVTYYPVS